MNHICRWGLVVACVVSVGCTERLDLDQAQKDVYRLVRVRDIDSSSVALAIIERVIDTQPTARVWNDSLARADSLDIAYLYRIRVSILYSDIEEAPLGLPDTIQAVFAFIDMIPWTKVWGPRAKVQSWTKYSELSSELLALSQSANMARLSYQAFERAKRLALDHGDPMYIHLADSSYKATARRVLTMPDSVRVAFGPAPDRPAHIPWVLATLAAAFIALSLSGATAGKGGTCRGTLQGDLATDAEGTENKVIKAA